MDSLIPLINSLQDSCVQNGIPLMELPCIAVVGSQSSGKSSVLEAVIGLDILPRGTGIVTRRPLIIQCHNTAKDSTAAASEYGEFLHCPGRKFTDKMAIREEIISETDRICKGTEISPIPINLKFYSKKVVDLTLIDLPGITRFAMEGQDQSICDEINDMVLSFIRADNCLILAVSAANTDLANSDALRVSKQVDPDGNRTIGVLTKLDLMDQGTDAMAVLSNQSVKLKHGWIGVVNRSQKDIEMGKTLEACLVSEKSFFASHPRYASIKETQGTPFLRSCLKEKLVRHIQVCFPKLKRDLRNQYEAIMNQLKSKFQVDSILQAQDMMDRGPLSDSDCKALMVHLLHDVERDFRLIMDGDPDVVSWDEMTPSAKISSIFTGRFVKDLRYHGFAETAVTDEEIRMVISNTTGLKTGVFVPDSSFEAILRRQVKKMEEPSLRCAQLVQELIADSVKASLNRIMERYPSLMSYVQDQMSDFVNEIYRQTSEKVSFFVAMQTSFMRKQTLPTISSLVSGAKEGYLTKNGGSSFSRWRRRFFRLIGNIIYYFPNELDDRPLAGFSLENVHVTEVATKKSKQKGHAEMSILISQRDGKALINGRNQIVLIADNMQDHKDWLQVFLRFDDSVDSGNNTTLGAVETIEEEEEAEDTENDDGNSKGISKRNTKPTSQQQQSRSRATSYSSASISPPRRSRVFDSQLLEFNFGNSRDEHSEIAAVRKIIFHYLSSLHQSIEENIPKIVTHAFVNVIKREIGGILINNILSKISSDQSLQDSVLADIRENCNGGKDLDSLVQKANAINQMIMNLGKVQI